MISSLPVGTEVGSHRWPLDCAHPDCWGRPWRGVVIHDPALVEAQTRGWATDMVAVAWDFGRTYWERAASLRPYAADLSAWEEIRAVELSR